MDTPNFTGGYPLKGGNNPINATSPATSLVDSKQEVYNDASEEEAAEEAAAGIASKASDYNLPYLDKQTIIIGLISDLHVESVYRRVNNRSLGDRRDFIGSSVISTRSLMGNTQELNAYMPHIIGLAANHPEFATRVRSWLCNIQVPVDSNGKVLNTSFRYNKKADFQRITKQISAIDTAYEEADKSNALLLRKAIETRVRELIEIESTKYLYGTPENVTDYIIYRHCLLYRDVAKDPSVSNFDMNVRFYIRDENKIQERAKKRQVQINKAKRNYLDAISDFKRFSAIFAIYCVNTGRDLLAMNTLDTSIKEQLLDKFSMEQPDKFNAIFNNQNLMIRGFIEECVAHGELKRSAHNQNLSLPDGTFIGANVNEAIVFFNNSSNADIKKALEQKLKFA